MWPCIPRQNKHQTVIIAFFVSFKYFLALFRTSIFCSKLNNSNVILVPVLTALLTLIRVSNFSRRTDSTTTLGSAISIIEPCSCRVWGCAEAISIRISWLLLRSSNSFWVVDNTFNTVFNEVLQSSYSGIFWGVVDCDGIGWCDSGGGLVVLIGGVSKQSSLFWGLVSCTVGRLMRSAKINLSLVLRI